MKINLLSGKTDSCKRHTKNAKHCQLPMQICLIARPNMFITSCVDRTQTVLLLARNSKKNWAALWKISAFKVCMVLGFFVPGHEKAGTGLFIEKRHDWARIHILGTSWARLFSGTSWACYLLFGHSPKYISHYKSITTNSKRLKIGSKIRLQLCLFKRLKIGNKTFFLAR